MDGFGWRNTHVQIYYHRPQPNLNIFVCCGAIPPPYSSWSLRSKTYWRTSSSPVSSLGRSFGPPLISSSGPLPSPFAPTRQSGLSKAVKESRGLSHISPSHIFFFGHRKKTEFVSNWECETCPSGSRKDQLINPSSFSYRLFPLWEPSPFRSFDRWRRFLYLFTVYQNPKSKRVSKSNPFLNTVLWYWVNYTNNILYFSKKGSIVGKVTSHREHAISLSFGHIHTNCIHPRTRWVGQLPGVG